MPETAKPAWNKGRVVGKKPPLTPDQVALIRLLLRQDKAWRDLALFNVALDTSLRGSDLVRLQSMPTYLALSLQNVAGLGHDGDIPPPSPFRLPAP